MKSLKRKCIVTYKITNIDELIRIVKLPNGEFEVNSNKQGRGAYIKKDISLFEKVRNNKLLHKAFKTKVPNDIYEKLKKEMG